jgi:hypothetical protein
MSGGQAGHTSPDDGYLHQRQAIPTGAQDAERSGDNPAP